MRESKASICKADIESLKTWLLERLHPNRFEHSLGTYEMTLHLAESFGFDAEMQEKASIAALLHDAAKEMTPKALFQAISDFNIEISEEERESPQTLHGPVGAEQVRQAFDLSDADILNAIRYHTTGRELMSTVEKLVYVADKIEQRTRRPEFTEMVISTLRFSEPATLDTAILTIMNSTIRFLLDQGQIIHPRTLQVRNELVKQHKLLHTTS